jgi:Protein of unknown function (DUF2934)
MSIEDRIRRRAHEIWEREGRPEGRREEHWAQARREIEAEGGSQPEPAAPDASPTDTAPGIAGTGFGQAAAPRSGSKRRRHGLSRFLKRLWGRGGGTGRG